MQTLQEMYFKTEHDMQTAIDWLGSNQTTPDDYEVQDQGLYPDTDYWFLKIWFANVQPLAVNYYNGVADVLYDPWAEPPPDEDPEDPPEG